jgi:hypothetical protein
MNLKHFSLARTLLITGSLAGIALAATSSQAQNDPPFGWARVARTQGNVSIQPAGADDWGQAYADQPLGPGDRVYTDQQGRGELQAAVVRAYLGANTDATLVSINPNGVEIGIAQGSASFYSDGFPPTQGSISVQTPNGAVTVPGRASFRIDVYPDEQSSVVTNYGNYSAITLNGGGGFYLNLDPGQSVQLSGTNPVYAQPLQAAPFDDFQHWSTAFEARRGNSISARYVSNEMPGYDQLDEAGDWQPQSDYGPIWFPHVEAGWAPYHNGHWVNVRPYGWTWVADEPWGAAPFHYGRWAVVSGRWGWIPGPREAHPVWSPAQVVFAGGVQIGGAGVSVWFPLGPGEAYKPWYPCSPEYVNRINITNIHESRVVHVQTTYVNIVNVTNVTYVNRTVGVTAMRQEDFAAGHSTKAVAVRVDPRQMEHVQVAAPAVRPPAQPVILHPVVRPAAVQQQRPVLVNNKGQQAAAVPNAKPVVIPVKAAPPAPRPIPGHVAAGAPTLGGKPVAPSAAPAPTPAPAQASRPIPGNPPAAPGNRNIPAPPGNVRPATPVTSAPAPVTNPAAPANRPAPAPPANVRPAAPAPAAPVPITPAPVNRPAPSQPAPVRSQAPVSKPEAPAIKTPPPPASTAPAPKPLVPPTARPLPQGSNVRPANPPDAKPVPPAKDDKKGKDDKKKDDKKKDEKKPE